MVNAEFMGTGMAGKRRSLPTPSPVPRQLSEFMQPICRSVEIMGLRRVTGGAIRQGLDVGDVNRRLVALGALEAALG